MLLVMNMSELLGVEGDSCLGLQQLLLMCGQSRKAQGHGDRAVLRHSTVNICGAQEAWLDCTKAVTGF